MTRILLVEDEKSLSEPLSYLLRREGYEVQVVDNGLAAVSAVEAAPPDLMLLDLMLPGLPGTEVCREVRQSSSLPIIMLTAKDSEVDIVVGLELGADDYVTKPFAFEELLARAEALLRRPRAMASPQLRVADLELDQGTREVRRAGELIELTPKEFAVLEYLMRHAGRVMSRTLITEYAWGYHFDPGTNIVDVVINHLRKKIDARFDKKLITTVRGVGYMIRA